MAANPQIASTEASTIEVALAKFNEGFPSFQSLVQGLLDAANAEREELHKAREKLEQDRKQFEEECQRVQQVLSDTHQVTLNVGGHLFTTSVTTLRNAPSPSLFNAMFSGRHELKTDDKGHFFIDRDGRHFHDILNFLRDGQFNYPLDGKDFKYLLELRAEAEYYGLCGLVTHIDRFPYGLVKVTRATALNSEDTWMYEDGQDEIVLTVDRPCQLVAVGFCGTDGGMTVELEVYEVDPEDFTQEISTLQTCAQSFTKADGQIPQIFLPAPVTLTPGKFYMVSALIKGTESYCTEDCLERVIAGGVTVQFQSWESPNGTNEHRGQFPELFIRPLHLNPGATKDVVCTT